VNNVRHSLAGNAEMYFLGGKRGVCNVAAVARPRAHSGRPQFLARAAARNASQHCLAGLALLAVAMHSTALMAQHRIGFLSPDVQVARAHSQGNRLAAVQDAPSQSILESEVAPPVIGPPAESGIRASVGADTPTLEHDFLAEDCACDTCTGSGDGGAQDCPSYARVCQPCLLDGWIQGEFLMWWPRPMDIPALVTSGTLASEGVLGQSGTQTLVGDQLLDQTYSGGRLRLGLWADPCHQNAWEVEGFCIGEETDRYALSGTGAAGSSVLARPFFNVLSTTESQSGREDAELIAFPGQLSGTVTVEATSQLYGVGIHGLRTFSRSCDCGPAVLSCECTQVDRYLAGFIGWRYVNFAEDLRINENLTSLLASPDNGQFLIEDRFETRNTFNGADLGVVWKGCRGKFSLDLLMRMAIGTNHQNVLIDGSSTLRGSGGTGNNFENATGGLLAQRTNIGEYTRNRFAVVPELGVTLGCAISPQWRATVGYTFLYWSSVVRPGDQIDRDVNPNLFPPETAPFTGLERPTFQFAESDLWVNGLNFGLECTW
jgi:hypothetical protein